MKKIKIRVIRKPLPYWTPNIPVSEIIFKEYRRVMQPGDIIIISDKALSIAYGYMYDESVLKAGYTYKMAAFLISRILWGRILHHPFSTQLREILLRTPLDLIARHKKLALYIGGIKHLVKPVSEAGIDATNLPYTYVSLPNPNSDKIAMEIRSEIESRVKYPISILVVDTDKTYKVKGLNIALSTRPSSIKNIIDLGGYAYLLGKYFKKYFIEYPTPVAYTGRPLPLNILLWLSKAVEDKRGYGAGRNIFEMYKTLGVSSYNEITWGRLGYVKHYPVILARLKFLNH